MKKMLLIIAGLIGTITVNAQSTKTDHNVGEYLSLGPVGGVGMAWVGNMGSGNRVAPTGYLGVGLIYSRMSHWGLGTGLDVSAEGYRYRDAYGNTLSATPIYLRMPMRAYYFFGSYKSNVRPKVYLGPDFGLKLAENDNMTASDAAMANVGTFRTFDFGLDAGAGVNVKVARRTWLNLDLGYYQGLLDAVKDPAGNYNVNHNLTFNAGVLFGIR